MIRSELDEGIGSAQNAQSGCIGDLVRFQFLCFFSVDD
jgi:hypothetical protein